MLLVSLFSRGDEEFSTINPTPIAEERTDIQRREPSSVECAACVAFFEEVRTIKTFIQTNKAPQPRGAYSQGILLNGLLFTAGMGPINPETGEVVGTSVEEQTHQVMKNLGAILQEAGLDFSDVVKATVHLQDLKRDFAGFNQAYQHYFKNSQDSQDSSGGLPVRTTVGSTLNNILVEIDFVAGRG